MLNILSNNLDSNKKDKSSRYFHAEAATSAAQNAGVAYQAPSMIAAGAGAQLVALFSALSNLAFSFLLVKIPSLIESRSSLKKVMLVMGLSQVLGWLPLIAVLFFSRVVNPLWLIPLWILSLLPVTMLIPVRDSWLARTIPPGNMGRYLGVRTAISAAAYLGTLILAGFFLDFYNAPVFTGYAWLFLTIFLAAVGSFILYNRIRQPAAVAAESKTTLSFRGFLKETRKGYLARFVLYTSIFTFTVNMASPFFNVYMLRDLHFSYWTFTIVASTEYLARIVSLAVSSRYIDRTGSLRILAIACYIIPFGPILWLFSSNILYIMVIQLLTGTGWAAFELSTQTFVYKAAPTHNLFRYIVYQKSLNALAIALGALAGAYLVKFMAPVFGNRILGMFLLSALLRIVVVRMLFTRLTERELPDKVFQNRPLAAAGALNWSFPSPNGLFYRPEEWKEYAGSVMPPASRPKPSGTVVFHKLREWLEYPPASVGLNRPSVPTRLKPQKHGLFYQRQGWVKYRQDSLESILKDKEKGWTHPRWSHLQTEGNSAR